MLRMSDRDELFFFDIMVSNRSSSAVADFLWGSQTSRPQLLHGFVMQNCHRLPHDQAASHDDKVAKAA